MISLICYELIKLTEQPKIVIIAETGTIPSAKDIFDEKEGWASYMTWSHEYSLSEVFAAKEEHKEIYNFPYAITKDELSELH